MVSKTKFRKSKSSNFRKTNKKQTKMKGGEMKGGKIFNLEYKNDAITNESDINYSKYNRRINPLYSSVFLDEIASYPNNNKNFVYHSLFMCEVKYTLNLDAIKSAIHSSLIRLIDSLNENSNIKLTMNDVKIHDFKFKYTNTTEETEYLKSAPVDNLLMTGSVYITDRYRVKLEVDKTLRRNLDPDTKRIVQAFTGIKSEKKTRSTHAR